MGQTASEGSTTAVARPAGVRTDDDRGSASVGATLGRYVVIEEVGRGGMGRVFRAYDPRLEREVAIKELRRALLGSEGTARLIAEARAMAKLSHQNVVSVYDVESIGDGELLLVMEYVAGGTLRDWLTAQRPWREIVARFVDAGRGLAAAHDAGLLHRDFKPANVLLGAADVVKVSDFGLAKPVGAVSVGSAQSEDSDESGDPLTAVGMVMGTPRYMAPEQHRGESLTGAADQYAFCVALWAALEGQAPFSGGELLAQKVEGPPAFERAGVPRAFAEAIRRGLAPDPAHRWRDMPALLAALSDDPARGRRRRWMAGVAGVAVAGIGAASFGLASAQTDRCSGAQEQLAPVWNPSRRAEIESAMLGVDAPYASAVWERAAARLDAYATQWKALHTETCEASTVRGEQSAAVMDLRMTCLHRARVDLDAAVSVLAAADIAVVRRAHEVLGQLPGLADCADIERLQSEAVPPPPAEAPAVDRARAHLAAARAESGAGRYEPAHEEVNAARAELESVAYGPVQTELALEDGLVLDQLGDYDGAVRAFEAALESAGRFQQPRLMGMAATRLVFVVGFRQQHTKEGLSYAALARGLSTTPAEAAAVHGAMTTVLAAQGKYAEAVAEARSALALWEEAVGPDDPSVATARTNLGNVLGDVGQHPEAIAEHRRALEILERTVGPKHPDVALARDNLGTALFYGGDTDAAVIEHRKAEAIGREALGADHLLVAMTLNNLGNVLQSAQKHDEAQAALRRALPVFEKELGADHPYVAQAQTNLARSLLDVGRPAEALPLAEASWTRRGGDDVPPELRGDTRFVLARARFETATDDAGRRSAWTMAEAAAEDFRTGGDMHAELVEHIEQWLDAHVV